MRAVLVGSKVRMRLVERSDLSKRAQWINDPILQETLNFDVPVSLIGTEKWLDRVVGDRRRRDFSAETMEGELIGFGGFLDIDLIARKAEIYGSIGEAGFRGGGYGSDLYKLLCDYGFGELGLERIYAYQLTHNVGAHRMLAKLGWTREGLLRRDLWSHGELVDRYLVSILREEWLGRGRAS